MGYSEEDSDNDSGSYNGVFAESVSSIYNGYQQSWRMLGFYVECTSSSEVEGNINNKNNNNNKNNKNNNYQMNTCQRYLLWAAYVDENYQGGGIGEYSFYNPETNEYDSSLSCDVHGNGRCVPMDCHDIHSTTWKLLGIYKEAYYATEWFEQLFKHEGYCLWSYDDYTFMHNNYYAWPEGCVAANFNSAATGQALYFDLKPTVGGYMAYALYTDNICKTELADEGYEAMSSYTSQLEKILGKKGYLYGSYLEDWNKQMNVYKYCQPCRTYNLYYKNGNKNRQRRRLEDEDYDPNDGYFACYDDADYTNVNQCMKFRTHTYMQAATIQNLQTAHQQGGILEISISGHVYGSSLDTISVNGTNPEQRQWNENGEEVQESLSQTNSATVLSIKNSLQLNEKEVPLFVSACIVFVLGILFLLIATQWKRHRANERQKLQLIRQPLVPDPVSKNKRNQGITKGVMT